MQILKKISKFDFFSNTPRDLRDVLGRCLGRDLGPSVINIFSKNHIFSRTSGNGLINILALSDRQIDASGPFFRFCILFNLGGIIGRPFRHNRLSWRHNKLSWRNIFHQLRAPGKPFWTLVKRRLLFKVPGKGLKHYA